jgi:two-component system nitrogen regulation response regulator NtrX
VIAATNKKLEDEISRNTFREDLFYRLNVIPFNVPALRERTGDISIIASHFVSQFCKEYGRKRKEFTPAAIEVLVQYPWPGNVRELKNLVERLVIVCPSEEIEPQHLPPELFRGASKSPQKPYESLHEARSAYEREFVLRKLEENRWNMTKAALALGLERSHLYRKMRTLGIATAKE